MSENINNPNNPNNPNNMPISFITSDYRELFTIPDGGYININKENGEILTRQCRFHGETHVDLGIQYFQVYHICQLAEMMESNGSVVEPCRSPEINHGYMITDRMPVGDKVFVLAYNSDAVQKYVTWQGRNDRDQYYAWGHYWQSHSDAWMDYFNRHDAERSGRVYDHTRLQKQVKNRDDAR